jgi:hypothetical protein
MRSTPKWPAWVVVASVLLLQTGWLRFLGIAVPFQLGVLLIGAVVGWVGWVAIRPVLGPIKDHPARIGLAFLAGLSILTAASTVLFHKRIGRLIGLASLPAAARASLALVVGGGVLLWALTRHRARAEAERQTSVATWVCLAMGALVMSALTLHGIANASTPRLEKLLPEGYPISEAEAPNWGRPGDYLVHLVRIPSDIVEKGLPAGRQVAHRGVQVWMLSASLPLTSGSDALDPLRAAKVLTVAVWFALFSIGRFVFRYVFALSPRVAGLGTASLALFAPVNAPLLQVSMSPYLGLVNASGGMYHNITQLHSVALGIGAIALIGSSLQGQAMKIGAFAYGTGLLAMSAWFKPGLFLVLAPVMGVLALTKMRRHRAASLIGAAILALPVVALLVYPAIVGQSRYNRGTGIDLLGGYVSAAAKRFPDWVVSSKWALALAILTLSFAVWAIPVCSWIGRALRRWRSGGALQAMYGGPKELSIALATSLAIAVVIAFLVVEPRSPNTGNFRWPVQAAYVVALPVLFRLIVEIRSRWWRWVTWGLLAIHLWGGLLHLYLFTVTGKT